MVVGKQVEARWVAAAAVAAGAKVVVGKVVVEKAVAVVAEKAAAVVPVTGTEQPEEERAGAGTAGVEMDSVEAPVDSGVQTCAQIPSGRSCIRQMQTQSRHGRCFRGFLPGSSIVGN